MKYSLQIHDLLKQVNLGCTDSERSKRQPVSFDIEILFPKQPLGCETDDLGGTVCYAKLTQVIDHLCRVNEFHLIEKLAHSIFTELKKDLIDGEDLKVQVTKLQPPIADLEGGTSFTIQSF